MLGKPVIPGLWPHISVPKSQTTPRTHGPALSSGGLKGALRQAQLKGGQWEVKLIENAAGLLSGLVLSTALGGREKLLCMNKEVVSAPGLRGRGHR